ncbi:MAG TPA: hypothetical protein DF383_12325 [Deltaproteobacteria bacterium]|nr:hypothetical protein [Deltaproteobacteria bacterium]
MAHADFFGDPQYFPIGAASRTHNIDGVGEKPENADENTVQQEDDQGPADPSPKRMFSFL